MQKTKLTQWRIQHCRLDIHLLVLIRDTKKVAHVVRYRFGRRQPFETVHRRINYCIHSIVTSPICIAMDIGVPIVVAAVEHFDFDSDSDCNCTDRNGHGCFWFHSNPWYRKNESVHSLRIYRFVIKSRKSNENNSINHPSIMYHSNAIYNYLNS